MKSPARNEISTLIVPTPEWTGRNPCASLFGVIKRTVMVRFSFWSFQFSASRM